MGERVSSGARVIVMNESSHSRKAANTVEVSCSSRETLSKVSL